MYLPLSEREVGEEVRVAKLDTFGNEELKQRLLSLGFTPATKIKIVSSYWGNDRVVEIRGTRIAIDNKTGNMVITYSYDGKEQEESLDDYLKSRILNTNNDINNDKE